MVRVLFTTLAAVGHVAPLAAIATELARRGHAVGWAAHASVRAHLRPESARVFDVDVPATATPRHPGRALAHLRTYFRDVLPGAADAMLPGVRTAIEAFQPDVVVTEQNCIAGSIGARLAAVPWVSVHVTPIFLLRPADALPGAQAWIDRQVGQVQHAHGVAPLPWPLRGDRTLVASSAEFLGPQAALHQSDDLVGALVAPTPADTGVPAAPRPRVLVSLGTETGPQGDAFLRRVIAALPPDVAAVVVGPRDLPAPPRVRVEPWIPQLAWLPHVDAVVSHGGQNTVTEALLHGLPMVVAPVQYDQPAVATRVEALGAGLRVSFQDATVEQLHGAIHRVLHQPSFAEVARRIGATLGPGTRAAADIVIEAAA